MKLVREVVSREIIDDLWGAGYTILPRRRHADPLYVPVEMVPQGRSYQWMHLVHDKYHYGHGGWAAVPASRHDGYFMPAGHIGDIEVNGLGLFEKLKFKVDAEHAENNAKAHKLVTDWVEKNSGIFTGEISINGDKVQIGATKTIEDVTKIPRELMPYIAQIFEERDRLGRCFVDGDIETKWAEVPYMVYMKENPDASRWPTLNALLLPTAIETIRKRITEEATSGQASEH
jgi:hypothetical protein